MQMSFVDDAADFGDGVFCSFDGVVDAIVPWFGAQAGSPFADGGHVVGPGPFQ